MARAKPKAAWLSARWFKYLLWVLLGVWLAASLLLEMVFHRHGHFSFEGFFGFWAIYGFFGCLILCMLAKILRLIVKRPRDYYHV